MAIWFSLVLFVAFTVLGELLRPKPEFKNAEPAGLGDFRFPTASETRKIPLLFGTVKIEGPNVVWYGSLLQVPIKKTVRTGLFSKETFIVGYRYYIGIQSALCRGPVDGLRRWWIGDTLVVDGTVNLAEHEDDITIDQPELFGGDELGNGGYQGTYRFFAGTATQAASTYLANHQDVNGATPAYRSTCYLAPAATRVYVGNSPNIDANSYEIVRVAVADANPLGLATPEVNDLDANPANVLVEIMTDTDWGMKIPSASIGTSFTTHAATLRTEGNGFSMIVDSEMPVGRLLQLVERQIDGVVYFDLETGKWELALARDDYDETLLVEFTGGADGNIVDVETFTRGTWEGTANIYSVEYADREDDYTERPATAQNDANIEIQGGSRVYAGDRYPGVKSAALADQLAWRDLAAASTPLAVARVVTDRTTWAVKPLDVVKLSFAARDFAVTDLLMRVKSIDRGSLEDGRIVYELVEDVFRAGTGVYGAPPATGWEPPTAGIVAFPTDEQLAFEAPRALCARDPFGVGPTDDRVFAAARKQSAEVIYDVRARHSSSTPSGVFGTIGTGYDFVRIGDLASTLAVGSAVPLSTLTIDADPDSQADLLALFPGSAATAPSEEEMGTALLGLVYVGSGGTGEFMLVSWATTNSAQIDLRDVYRGALDSVQTEHAAGTHVYALYGAAVLSDESIEPGHNVDVKLIPRSFGESLAEGSATTISFAMANRTRRPYAPSRLSLDGTAWATTIALEAGGVGEGLGIPVTLRRRDFRTENEVASLEQDAGALATDFPTAQTTTHEVEIVNDPDGTPTTILTYDLGSGADSEVPRLEILRATDGVLPTRLRFRVRAVHNFEGSSWDSRVDLVWDFDVTSDLTGHFNFGALDTSDTSTLYTVTEAGIQAFTLSSSFTAGDVQYRLNGGSWTTLISGGNVAGNIAGTTVGDTIEVRHTSNDTGALKLLQMAAKGAGQDAYAVLFV